MSAFCRSAHQQRRHGLKGDRPGRAANQAKKPGQRGDANLIGAERFGVQPSIGFRMDLRRSRQAGEHRDFLPGAAVRESLCRFGKRRNPFAFPALVAQGLA